MTRWIVLVSLATWALGCAEANTSAKYEFVIEDAFVSPDGCDRPALTVNGQFPGPEIRVQQGQWLEVTVVNQLPSSVVTLHWHGFHPIDPWMDGHEGVTQCGIHPLSSFTYTFQVLASEGTYWWHAHSASQRLDGLYGTLIVEPDVDETPAASTPLAATAESESLIRSADGEFSMMLNDWYHEGSWMQSLGLRSAPFKWIGDPAIILFNGKSRPNETFYEPSPSCQRVEEEHPSTPLEHEVFEVELGKSYFFRIINVGALSYLVVQFHGFNMTIVEVDASLVQPMEVPVLDINIGQRFGVIVTPTQAGNFWVSAETRFRNLVTGAAVLHVKDGTTEVADPQTLASPVPRIPEITGFEFRLLKAVDQLPADMRMEKADTVLVVNGLQVENEAGNIFWDSTLGVYHPPKDGTPVMSYMYAGRGQELEGTAASPFIFNQGQVIDIVFQNQPSLSGKIEQHPWHMHGHAFYVLGFGAGNFSTSDEPKELNLLDPLKVDIVTVYPNLNFTTTETVNLTETSIPPKQIGTGWVLSRFKAKNPGVWAVHCHINAHLVMGMQIMIAVQPDALQQPRHDMPSCGRTQEFHAVTFSGDTSGSFLYFDTCALLLLAVLSMVALL